MAAKQLCVALVLVCVAASLATPLDDYVKKPDANYKWVQLNKTYSGPGYKAYLLNMTSQQWLNNSIVDRSIWWHYLFIVIPDNWQFKETGLVYITGGGNGDKYPTGGGEDELLCITLALSNRASCTVVFDIPNQPIHFLAEQPPRGRSEDAIIAYTWNHFLDHPDQPEWLLRLPMTKAVVRAMDATTEFITKTHNNAVQKFIVAGASKRGWTTWTTGAVDTRVIAIIPIVMDALNFHTNIHHFWRAFGGWTFALKDYYDMNFTRRLDDPNLPQMTAIIDPLSYKDRLTMPKLVVDSTGDEFFMPDDNHYWWTDMEGEMHLLMVHNAEHSLVTGLPEVVQGVSSFMAGVLQNVGRPEMRWVMSSDDKSGNITVYCSERPTKIMVRHADTLDGKRRDWRLLTGQNPCPTIQISGACVHPVLWHESDPVKIDDLTYTYSMDIVPNRWRAFLIEAEFRGANIFPFVFTTQVNIIPNTFPFADCSGDGCTGTLI